MAPPNRLRRCGLKVRPKAPPGGQWTTGFKEEGFSSCSKAGGLSVAPSTGSSPESSPVPSPGVALWAWIGAGLPLGFSWMRGNPWDVATPLTYFLSLQY